MNGPPLQVRDAVAADAPLIAEFNSALALESEGKRLDSDTVRRGVERALAQPELCRYFLVESAGHVAGQLMLTYEWTDWRDGVFWWIQSVYVRPEFRRQGAFRALFEHAAALARSTSDVRGLRLYVEHQNHAAQATYERLGLAPSGHALYEIDWS